MQIYIQKVEKCIKCTKIDKKKKKIIFQVLTKKYQKTAKLNLCHWIMHDIRVIQISIMMSLECKY